MLFRMNICGTSYTVGLVKYILTSFSMLLHSFNFVVSIPSRGRGPGASRINILERRRQSRDSKWHYALRPSVYLKAKQIRFAKVCAIFFNIWRYSYPETQ
jgi:hypothetical protein